ncbi:MAG: transposase [Coriobacteriaceae bacterium]
MKLELFLDRSLKTITPERGKQFARHVEVTKALRGVQFCFCELHHLWQKPTVKNTDGLIREFFLKGTDFSRVAGEEVQHAVELICDRARKVLGYKTANEVFREMLHSA